MPNEGAADGAGGVSLHGLFTHSRPADHLQYKVTTEKLRNDSLLLLSFIKKAADVVKNPILFLPITQKVVNWCGGQKKRRKC